MIQRSRLFMFAVTLLMSIITAIAQKQVTDYVDPFIGTTNFSVCHPGAVTPHGLMSVVPFNVMGSDLNQFDKDSRWWSAPYERNNSYLTGFAHVDDLLGHLYARILTCAFKQGIHLKYPRNSIFRRGGVARLLRSEAGQV